MIGIGIEGERKRKRKRSEERRREREKREKEAENGKKKIHSPLDRLLLVRLGVGEAFDGPGLAPEEASEVGALERVLVGGVGEVRRERREKTEVSELRR